MSFHHFPDTWTRRISQILPNGDTASPGLSFLGDNPITSGTVAAVIGSDGIFNSYTTGAVSGNDAGIQGRDMYRRALSAAMYVRFKLNQTSNCRIFIGFTDQLLATMVGADIPSGHYFGLQYSTPRGDTQFKLVMRDGTTQTLSDIAAVDTNYHDLYLSMFSAVTTDSILLGFDNVLPIEKTTNVLSNVNNYRFVAAIETETSLAKVLEVGTCRIHQVY